MDLSFVSADRPEKVSLRSTEYRKVIKPLLERRRRARINSCLDELKSLILETTENENADASKLEKADILELTVRHLRNFRHRQQQQQRAEDKFKAGFSECAHQVSSFLSSEDHSAAKSRLMSHLAGCIDRIPNVVVRTSDAPTPPPSPNNCPTEPLPHTPRTILHPPPPPPTSTDYVTCTSPDYGRHRVTIRDARSHVKEELLSSAAYYSSVPALYLTKLKSESESCRPWRPW